MDLRFESFRVSGIWGSRVSGALGCFRVSGSRVVKASGFQGF